MQHSVVLSREAVNDLLRVKEDFDAIIESIELMSNKEFMESYKKAKEQIKKREFAECFIRSFQQRSLRRILRN